MDIFLMDLLAYLSTGSASSGMRGSQTHGGNTGEQVRFKRL